MLKLGKKRLIAIGYIGAGLSLIAMYFVNPANIAAQLLLHGCYGLFCFSFPIPMSMIPEAINYQEDKIGIRSDGIAYSTTSLSTKIGSAFSASLGLLLMGALGYVANAQQTPQAITGIKIAVNLLYGILYLLALIPLYFYPLDEKKNAAIQASLDAKREAAAQRKC